MDFTLMIVCRQYGTAASGYAITSQLKTFSTRELAERIAQQLDENEDSNVKVIKLYI